MDNIKEKIFFQRQVLKAREESLTRACDKQGKAQRAYFDEKKTLDALLAEEAAIQRKAAEAEERRKAEEAVAEARLVAAEQAKQDAAADIRYDLCETVGDLVSALSVMPTDAPLVQWCFEQGCCGADSGYAFGGVRVATAPEYGDSAASLFRRHKGKYDEAEVALDGGLVIIAPPFAENFPVR